jgi:hypothetical protein
MSGSAHIKNTTVFRSICWELFTDVSGQPISLILKGQEPAWPLKKYAHVHYTHQYTHTHTHMHTQIRTHVFYSIKVEIKMPSHAKDSIVQCLHTNFCDEPQSSGWCLFFWSTILLTARIKVRRNRNGRTSVRGHRRENLRPTATK